MGEKFGQRQVHMKPAGVRHHECWPSVAEQLAPLCIVFKDIPAKDVQRDICMNMLLMALMAVLVLVVH